MRHRFSELIASQHILLTLLNKYTTLKTKKSIINNSDEKIIKPILEILKNTLNGNIVLSNKKKEKLSRYKSDLRSLVSKKLSLKKQKKLILKVLKVVIFILKNFFASHVWELIKNVK